MGSGTLETKILQQSMFLRPNYTREMRVSLVSLVVVGWEHVFSRLGLIASNEQMYYVI